jgi:ubiquitin
LEGGTTGSNAKANIDSPTFTGIPKVPEKLTKAKADGTLIATEAQVDGKVTKTGDTMTGNLFFHTQTQYVNAKSDSTGEIGFISGTPTTKTAESTGARIQVLLNGNITFIQKKTGTTNYASASFSQSTDNPTWLTLGNFTTEGTNDLNLIPWGRVKDVKVKIPLDVKNDNCGKIGGETNWSILTWLYNLSEKLNCLILRTNVTAPTISLTTGTLAETVAYRVGNTCYISTVIVFGSGVAKWTNIGTVSPVTSPASSIQYATFMGDDGISYGLRIYDGTLQSGSKAVPATSIRGVLTWKCG